ncbi:nodulation protein NfeD [Oceanobacillus profundus]|uniref:Nodulation protein NfeD n=1 Tax=Oceanobacillus profundus TaxID=372463 RepID=A0A417YJB5_9BACI|nr:nodulation protein NfeD [Oceanobacillus profundus]MBR3120181.1 nodulation protein NfeD [Oceanobacillus sp.]MCM3396862.1 nodulation protein NfeD [Oceanobacillus profundus]MDO6448162.1 nodulation protein NfeD [Oceanobacillus profundus]RHW33148.1 nodulation protein NfeD [Oceanobacillus profundus]
MMSRKRLKQYILIIAAISIALIYLVLDNISIASAEEQGGGKSVYVIPIEREVERGLEAFLERTTSEAVEAGADHIIFEIDTPGGRVDAAGQIGQIIQGLPIPTTAFIVNEALSAGSYIALFSETIYFKPHATMGASGVINSDGTAADEKAQSAWFAAMKSAAESTGRDPLYALAMADSSIDLPEYGAPEGRFLTLGPADAVEVGYANGIVDDRVELLHELGLSNASIIETEPTVAEEVARFLTNPIVIPILLSVASLGLIVELYSPGFGVPGIMGIVSLLLFFYGHIVAGLAGMEAVILLVLGIILIVAEFFVPGGILGLLGIGAIIGSLFMSGYDLGHMSMSIGIAFLVTLIVAIILFKRIGMDKGVFRHIILRDSTATEQGYVSSTNRLELIGMEGITATPLRPSGIGEFDGERIDIVSEGSFIDRNKSVKVVRVEGVRVVVREV